MPSSSTSLHRICLTLFLILICSGIFAQPGADALKWTNDGNSFYKVINGEITRVDLPGYKETVFLSKAQLTPSGHSGPLEVENFSFSADGKELLIYTNTRKVWRYNTRGDYWVLDLGTKQWRQLGKDRPSASLMFAKFSPDGNKVAYVSEHNIYLEGVADGSGKCLTSTDGTR